MKQHFQHFEKLFINILNFNKSQTLLSVFLFRLKLSNSINSLSLHHNNNHCISLKDNPTKRVNSDLNVRPGFIFGLHGGFVCTKEKEKKCSQFFFFKKGVNEKQNKITQCVSLQKFHYFCNGKTVLCCCSLICYGWWITQSGGLFTNRLPPQVVVVVFVHASEERLWYIHFGFFPASKLQNFIFRVS